MHYHPKCNFLLFSFALFLFLNACTDNQTGQTEAANRAYFAAPKFIQAAHPILPNTGSMRALLTIKIGATTLEDRVAMIVSTDGKSYSYKVENLGDGVHSFTIEFEFQYDDINKPMLPITTATQSDSGTETTISFSDSDYSLIDSNKNGVSNLDELITGVDPLAPTYLITGKAYGVSSGFQLQLNGVDVIMNQSNNDFELETLVIDSGNYLLTIASHGTANDRFCRVNNATGTVATVDVSNVSIYCLTAATAQYLLASNWNDYVVEATPGMVTLCTGNETGGYHTACIHSGLRRVVDLPAPSSCVGITAQDTLGLLQWYCSPLSGGGVRLASTELIEGAGLHNVIDSTVAEAPIWRENVVNISLNGSEIANTKPSVWWSNTLYTPTDFVSSNLTMAGGIYVIASSLSQKLSITANKIGLYIAPGATLEDISVGAETAVITAVNQQFIWIEGSLKINLSAYGILLDQVKFSVLNASDITGAISNAEDGSGILITDTSNVNPSVNNLIRSSHFYSNQIQINVLNSHFNTVSHVTAGNGLRGIKFTSSNDNILYDNRFFNFPMTYVTQNYGEGILIIGDRNFITNTIVANAVTGLIISGTNNIVGNLTTLHNSSGGMEASGNKSLFKQITSVNNGGSGIWLDSTDDTISDIVSIYNAGIGMFQIGNRNAYTGFLKVAFNDQGPCGEAGAAPNPGLVDGTCTGSGVDGSSDFGVSSFSNAILKTDLSGINNEFQGAALIDVTNSSNRFGKQSSQTLTDWTNFDNKYRIWGLSGNVFPNAYLRGRCVTEVVPLTCQIWDWRLKASGTHLLNIESQIATGNEFLSAGSIDILNHAVERMEDGIGNENTLCESNEHCIFSPNIGRYQGHGPLTLKQSEIDFVDLNDQAKLNNITMWEYSVNGVP